MAKKTYKKKPVAKKSIDKKQTRAIRQLQRDTKPELKDLVITSAANSLVVQNTNGYQITSIAAVPQGDGSNNRVGDKVKVKHITFNLTAYSANSAAQESNALRCIILHDKRWTGTDLTANQILSNYNTTNLSWNNFQSTKNIDYVNMLGQRGKGVDVLYDKVLEFGPLTTTATQSVADNVIKKLSYNKTFKVGKLVQFSGATAATGQIFVVIFPGNSTTNTQNPNYVWYSDVYYTDV